MSGIQHDDILSLNLSQSKNAIANTDQSAMATDTKSQSEHDASIDLTATTDSTYGLPIFERTLKYPPFNDKERLVRVFRRDSNYLDDLCRGSIIIEEQISKIRIDGSTSHRSINKWEYHRESAVFTPIFCFEDRGPGSVYSSRIDRNPTMSICIQSDNTGIRDFQFWAESDAMDFQCAISGYRVQHTISAFSTIIYYRALDFLGNSRELIKQLSNPEIQIWAREEPPISARFPNNASTPPTSLPKFRAGNETITPESLASGLSGAPATVAVTETRFKEPECPKLSIYGSYKGKKQLIVIPIDEMVDTKSHPCCSKTRLAKGASVRACCSSIAVSTRRELAEGMEFSECSHNISEAQRIGVPMEVNSWPSVSRPVRFRNLVIGCTNTLEKEDFMDSFEILHRKYLLDTENFNRQIGRQSTTSGFNSIYNIPISSPKDVSIIDPVSINDEECPSCSYTMHRTQKDNSDASCKSCGLKWPYVWERAHPQARGDTPKLEVSEKATTFSQLPTYEDNDPEDHNMKNCEKKEEVQDDTRHGNKDIPSNLIDVKSKIQVIYFVLQLLTWREATLRIGRESSISSSIINSEKVDSSPSRETHIDIEEYFTRLETLESKEDNYNYPVSTQEKIEWVRRKYLEHYSRDPEPMDTDGSTSRTQHETRTQETENSLKTASQKRNRRGGEEESTGYDDGQGDRNWPPRKIRRKQSIRSLNGRLACPFVKADPNTYLSCMSIGRQNLSGVKEHVRRNHFNTSSPPGLLAAKNWNAVFDFCIPNWPPREYPSPYVDMREIFFNAVNWNSITKSQGEGQEEVDCTYHGLKTTIETKSSQQKASKLPEPRPDPTDIIHAFQPQPQYDKSTTPVTWQLQTMATDNTIHALGGSGDNDISISESMTPLKPIAHPLGSLECGMCSLIQGTCFTCSFKFNSDPNVAKEAADPLGWGFTTGISPTLKRVITRMVSPDLDNLSANEIQEELDLSAVFVMEDLGIDTTLPPEDNYYTVMSSIDPNGEVFDPNTNFLMPNPQQKTLLASSVSISSDQNTPSLSASFPSITTSGIQTPKSNAPSRPPGPTENRKKCLLLISRRPANPNSTEGRRWKRFTFDTFGEFRNTFESWLKSVFTDPEFCWRRMEFYNDKDKVRLLDIDDVIDDLEGSFCQYRSNDASLFLVMKDGIKRMAFDAYC